MKIVPSILAKNKKELDDKFGKLIKISKEVQIDIMDGKFVKVKGGMLKDIPNLKRYKNTFEAHLMVKNPEKYISKLKKKGFDRVVFHYNSTKEVKSVVDKIHKLKMKAIVAFNPKVKIGGVGNADGVMFLGHVPGVEGVGFDSKIYKKIKDFKKKSKIKIWVDGGVNAQNIRKFKDLGVYVAGVGSFISGAENPKESLSLLRRKVVKNWTLTNSDKWAIRFIN